MSHYFQSYYTTGEFAKICRTTKETLFHYDQLGLIKPALIKDNGYRYYLSQQYFEYDFIKVLQESKMSLKDIQAFMGQRNNQGFIDVLNEKNQELENEKQRIDNMQYRIKQAISLTQYGMQTPHNQPYIENCQEEHLLVVTLPNSKMADKEMINYIGEHLDYCRQYDLTEELPLGSIVYQEHIFQHAYQENCYYVKLRQYHSDKHYKRKPKGCYAMILHEGFYDTIEPSITCLLGFITEQGYRLCGDMYLYEIHNHFTALNTQDYLIQISIPIEKIDKL